MRVPDKQRRRRLGGDVVSVQVPVTVAFKTKVDEFRREYRQLTKKPITKAFLFREGAAMLMRYLRVQMTRAQKGRLHAKIRESGK